MYVFMGERVGYVDLFILAVESWDQIHIPFYSMYINLNSSS